MGKDSFPFDRAQLDSTSFGYVGAGFIDGKSTWLYKYGQNEHGTIFKQN